MNMKIDKNFKPFAAELAAFSSDAKKLGGKSYAVCIERNDGLRQRKDFTVIATGQDARNAHIVERYVKSMLWVYGGYKIVCGGCEYIDNHLKTVYSMGGERDFDVRFMERVYEKPFEVISVDIKGVPDTVDFSKPRTFSLKGCRIGFDAGGSDRKVSAVIDGEAVYSEEVVWHPKVTSDPSYHYDQIVSAFKTAASHMPRVDAIGVSSAGIYINNRTMVASLFVSVEQQDFDKTVKNIYIDAAKQIGDVPLTVANDGDVTALAGAMSLGSNKILGIAMGTSEAAGYVDEKGNIRGWLNELAFVPVDLNAAADKDPWSGDTGVGATYFSQDGVIKLAAMLGIDLSAHSTPAEKLKAVQQLLKQEDANAMEIFGEIGRYLGHAIPFYAEFYDIENMLVLGRVTSGKGGELLIDSCNAVLKKYYPELYSRIKVFLPDEQARRVGQSIAAASLPVIK